MQCIYVHQIIREAHNSSKWKLEHYNREKIRGHSINHSLYIILLNSSGGWVKGLIDHNGDFPDRIAYSYYRHSLLSPLMRWEQHFLIPIPKISRVNVIGFPIFSWEINSPFTLTSERKWVSVCLWMTFGEMTSTWFCQETLHSSVVLLGNWDGNCT